MINNFRENFFILFRRLTYVSVGRETSVQVYDCKNPKLLNDLLLNVNNNLVDINVISSNHQLLQEVQEFYPL